MEQQILANKRSSSGDVELTLVSTSLSDYAGRTGLRGASSGSLSGRESVPCTIRDVTVSQTYLFFKRVIDIIVSLSVLLIGFFPLLIIAMWVRKESPGPAIHRRRVLALQCWDNTMGEGALQTFDAFKIRSMIHDADDYLQRNPHLFEAFQKDWKLTNDPRVTRFGAWLRASSVDEFPQLINVLKGQMTLVGPRMITVPELARYGNVGSTLLSVKPGLTGLWQVSGRQDLPYEERIRLDMAYIESRSLALDLEIMVKTFKCVLQRKGAY
jgi:lipopolysaccharide/colanic/teichoic acid biosynthesis glycosyltransferase